MAFSMLKLNEKSRKKLNRLTMINDLFYKSEILKGINSLKNHELIIKRRFGNMRNLPNYSQQAHFFY